MARLIISIFISFSFFFRSVGQTTKNRHLNEVLKSKLNSRLEQTRPYQGKESRFPKSITWPIDALMLVLDFSGIMTLKWQMTLSAIPNYKNPKFTKGIKRQYVFWNFGSLVDAWIVIFTRPSRFLPALGEQMNIFDQLWVFILDQYRSVIAGCIIHMEWSASFEKEFSTIVRLFSLFCIVKMLLKTPVNVIPFPIHYPNPFLPQTLWTMSQSCRTINY